MKNESTEIREAIAAGEKALNSLYLAQEKLKSARSWGMFDLFGGGLLSDMIKYSKMNDASKYMEEAKRQLQIFQKELKETKLSVDLRMEVSSFLSFADFFFDGLIADYMVQSKISSAREQVDDAIVMVTDVLNALKSSI